MFIKKIKQIKKDTQLIVLHHLGLGDSIICNGMVNYLSKKLEKVFLVVNERYFDQINYLYLNNSKIELLPVKDHLDKKILDFSKQKNLKILKVGFENRKKGPFNLQLYKQLGLNYKISFQNFQFPLDDHKSNELKKHLFKYYKIQDDFILVHSETDHYNFDLEIKSQHGAIHVEKNSDLFNNIFLYSHLIQEAKEIHCVDSSFIHFVERVNTNSILYYHKNRKSNTYLTKDWQEVNYGN